MNCMNPPTPELTICHDEKEQCCACGKWVQRGYGYSDLFICEDCAADGDALAMLAWKLAEDSRMSIYLSDEEFAVLKGMVDVMAAQFGPFLSPAERPVYHSLQQKLVFARNRRVGLPAEQVRKAG